MSQSNATLTIRTNRTLKEEVGKIFSQLGLNHSTAVNIFYRQVLAEKGIPFDLKITNPETLEALENSRSGENLTDYESSKTEGTVPANDQKFTA